MRIPIKKTRFKEHPLEIGQALNVEGSFYGIAPQYQRATVPPGGDCETVGDFTEETTGAFDVTATGSGKVGSNSITLTQTVAATDAAVYLLLSKSDDKLWANYIGFWYKGGDGLTFVANDIMLYLFTSIEEYLYADRTCAISLLPAYTEEGTAVWKYREIRIEDMTFATGKSLADLKTLWGVGFQQLAGTNGDTWIIDQIEFYTHPTGQGPARGTIVTAPLKDGVYVKTGYGVAWEATSGRIKVAADNEANFAGIVCEADNPLVTTFPAALATEFYVKWPERLSLGTARLWDTTYAEDVTISAIDMGSGKVTVAAITNAYTAAEDAKIAMYGTEVGGPTTMFVKDGVVNMTCLDTSIGAAGEGISLAAAGDAPMTIDDGGGSSQGVMVGRATELGVAKEVIPVDLRVAGTSA